MREKIIKLLKSDNADDRSLGKEYLRKFYGHEIFVGSHRKIAVLFNEDLNRILTTREFKSTYDIHSPYIYSKDMIILLKDDDWSMV